MISTEFLGWYSIQGPSDMERFRESYSTGLFVYWPLVFVCTVFQCLSKFASVNGNAQILDFIISMVLLGVVCMECDDTVVVSWYVWSVNVKQQGREHRPLGHFCFCSSVIGHFFAHPDSDHAYSFGYLAHWRYQADGAVVLRKRCTLTCFWDKDDVSEQPSLITLVRATTKMYQSILSSQYSQYIMKL